MKYATQADLSYLEQLLAEVRVKEGELAVLKIRVRRQEEKIAYYSLPPADRAAADADDVEPL